MIWSISWMFEWSITFKRLLSFYYISVASTQLCIRHWIYKWYQIPYILFLILFCLQLCNLSWLVYFKKTPEQYVCSNKCEASSSYFPFQTINHNHCGTKWITDQIYIHLWPWYCTRKCLWPTGAGRGTQWGSNSQLCPWSSATITASLFTFQTYLINQLRDHTSNEMTQG